MTLVCRISSIAPEMLSGRHRDHCLRCQAEAVRRRSLLRELGELRKEIVPAPAGLHEAVMSGLRKQDARAPRRVIVLQMAARHAAAAGVTAATAVALATGVLRWRSRLLA